MRVSVRSARLASVSLICGLVILPVAIGQQTEPMAVEDIIRTNSFGEVSPLAYSPDGKWLAYMIRDSQRIPMRGDNEEETYVRTGVYGRNQAGDIWIVNPSTNETRNLTGGIGANWQPTWSPDGRYLAFLSDREGDGQTRVWAWDSRKDKLNVVSKVAVRAVYLFNDMKWMPDSRTILVTTVPVALSMEEYLSKVLFPKGPEASSMTTPNSHAVVREANLGGENGEKPRSTAPFAMNSSYLHDLVLIDLATGNIRVLVHNQWIDRYVPSPNGEFVLFKRPMEFRQPPGKCDVVAVDVRTAELTVVVSSQQVSDFNWAPNSKEVAYGVFEPDKESFGYYVASVAEGRVRKVATLPPQPCCASSMPMWDAKGENLYFLLEGALWRAVVSEEQAKEFSRISSRKIAFRVWQSDSVMWSPDRGKTTVVIAQDAEQKRDGFYRIDLETGESTRLMEAGQCYSCKWNVDANSYVAVVPGNVGEQIAYIAEDVQHAPDLWVSDARFEHSRQVTDLNPQLRRYKMGSVRIVDWLGDDGDRLRGALLLPPDYQKEKKYPLIVWIYPGSEQSKYGDQFGLGDLLGPFNMQLLATRGYAVLFADSRYDVGEPSAGLAKSVLPGVNKVIEMGVADPKRIGIMGHSNGGYASLAMITQTRRFRAAIEADGYGDFIDRYATMHYDGSSPDYITVDHFLGQGGPWRYLLRFLENSPVLHLENVETPLLIIQGAKDPLVPTFLADEIFADMRYLGKQVAYAKYDSEDHAPCDWTYASQMDVANRMISWFETQLGPNPR
jgi:dipeptidyl aminopeptidase/acylaminoacyl peptidase